MPVVVTGERSCLLSRIYDNVKYNAAFDRCIDVMTKLMQKYGNQVLEKSEMNDSIPLPVSSKTEENKTLENAA